MVADFTYLSIIHPNPRKWAKRLYFLILAHYYYILHEINSPNAYLTRRQNSAILFQDMMYGIFDGTVWLFFRAPLNPKPDLLATGEMRVIDE